MLTPPFVAIMIWTAVGHVSENAPGQKQSSVKSPLIYQTKSFFSMYIG